VSPRGGGSSPDAKEVKNVLKGKDLGERGLLLHESKFKKMNKLPTGRDISHRGKAFKTKYTEQDRSEDHRTIGGGKRSRRFCGPGGERRSPLGRIGKGSPQNAQI